MGWTVHQSNLMGKSLMGKSVFWDGQFINYDEKKIKFDGWVISL